MTGFPAGLEPARDLSPAKWVEDALGHWPRGRPFQVRDLVPPVFEAYARILHRPWRPVDVRESTGSWSELARARGVSLVPGTPWEVLDRRHGGRWRVDEGSLSEGEVATLVELLRTGVRADAPCWFALWAGYAMFDPGASYLLARGTPVQRLANGLVRAKEWVARSRAKRAAGRLAKFHLLGGGRSYVLIQGSIGDAVRLQHELRFQSLTLWCPEDRSWLIHTEIDSTSTYLGGSRALIDRLVRVQVLESFEVSADDLAVL